MTTIKGETLKHVLIWVGIILIFLVLFFVLRLVITKALPEAKI